MKRYVPLWVKSHFSFLEGASGPDELVQTAHELGLGSMALTDRDGLYGIVRAHVAARDLGLSLLVGAELTIATSSLMDVDLSRTSIYEANTLRAIALCRDQSGYAALCRLISVAQTRGNKGEALVFPHELETLSGKCELLCPDAATLAAVYPHFGEGLWAYVTRHLTMTDQTRELQLRRAAEHFMVPLVGGTEVLYHHPSRRRLQDVVTCIRAKSTLARIGTRTRPNDQHALMCPDAIHARFADAPELLGATWVVAERCGFRMEQLDYRYPEEPRPDGVSAEGWLRQLTFEGAARRYPSGIPNDVNDQLERELSVISDLGYGGYFLTMREIVAFCRQQDILCQGRGSAANSAVCFCLGITAVDPVRMDLLFERFLSRERAEPPDIDLDIEHERREEVIQHVYDKYGRRRAAMVANVIRYRVRSAVREVGKVLGVPATDLDAVCRLLRHHDDLLDDKLLESAGLPPGTPVARLLRELSLELVDSPRHLSIHPGGFLLGEAPVDTLVPIEPATMPGRTVIQWDKYDVEAMGLFKVDLLGLGALTCIHGAFDLIAKHGGPALDIASVPAGDEATYDMVSAGDTVGVFQIESRAQMAMLPRLQPRDFYDLVIEVAIVRPGPIQGDMVHPYLRRRQGKEEVRFPHPKLERVLKKTLGVPIFQEQVMKLAVLVADYTPGEADQLRRDMAAWRRSGRIEKHRARLVGRMIENGIPNAFAERVFEQIRGFGEYGFPESHAASFALLAYVTAWLRRHHPAAFLCAILNAQPMGFYRPATLIDDAKRHGVEVRQISVQRSEWNSTLERGRGDALAVRVGLRQVKGIGERERSAIELARLMGPFRDLDDFARRTALATGPLCKLAEAGVFDEFGVTRRDALWAARALGAARKDSLALGVTETQLSFAALTPSERVAWDYRASEHSTAGHPMEALRPALDARRNPTARRVGAMNDGQKTRYVGMVICRQRPGTASGVTFFTMEDETGFVNVVVWRKIFEKHRTLAKTASLLGIDGKLQVSEGVTHLVAERLFAPEISLMAEPTRSRDFH